MELARAWFTSAHPVYPPEIAALLRSHEDTAGVVVTGGFLEHETPLPERANGRHHDLLLLGDIRGEPAVISVWDRVQSALNKLCIEAA